MPTSIICKGVSGTNYIYEITTPLAPWNKVPINYVFAHEVHDGWRICYAGECGDATTRMPAHEKWYPALSLNAGMRIFAHVSSSDAAVRRAEEEDLIARYNPQLNIRGRTAPTGLMGFRHYPVRHSILGDKQ